MKFNFFLAHQDAEFISQCANERSASSCDSISQCASVFSVRLWAKRIKIRRDSQTPINRAHQVANWNLKCEIIFCRHVLMRSANQEATWFRGAPQESQSIKQIKEMRFILSKVLRTCREIFRMLRREERTKTQIAFAVRLKRKSVSKAELKRCDFILLS